MMSDNPVTHGLDFLKVYVAREHDARTALVKLSHHDDPSVSLTSAEARALANALLVLAGTAERA